MLSAQPLVGKEPALSPIVLTNPCSLHDLCHASLLAGIQGSVVYGAISTMGTQLPQEVSSTIFSAEGPLHEEDSSPISTTQRARTGTGSNSSQHAGAPATPTGASAAHAGTAAAAARTTAPSPRQQAHLTASPVKAAAASSTAAPAARAQAAATEAVSPAAVRQAAGAGSAVSPDGGTSSRSKQVASPTVMTEIEDEYEETDLDDDWKALLGGVDARLKLQGARAMNARERAIAIKKLLVATGTRGVEFALNSTLQVRKCIWCDGLQLFKLDSAGSAGTPELRSAAPQPGTKHTDIGCA